jgi:iron complex transport system substrate-binding protein
MYSAAVRALLASLWLVALVGCARAGGTISSHGAGGRHRIVCLTPSSTEIVAALGAIDQIVGVDEYSRYPPAVHELPKVGSFMSPDLERILSLHPDILIADSVQTQVAASLQGTGITVVSIPMQTIDDVRHGLVSVAHAIGREKEGDAAVARLDDALAAVEKTHHDGPAPRVLFVVDREVGGLGKMVAAGPGTYLDELLRRAGGVNVLSDAPVRYVTLSTEEVIARKPDVILDAVHTDEGSRALADWDALASVPAVASHRVYLLSDSMVVSPGPRLATVLATIATKIWQPAP